MPYTEESLKKMSKSPLKEILRKMMAHKSAFSEERLKRTGLTASNREKEAKREDLVFARNYNAMTEGKKLSYLRDTILHLQDVEGMNGKKEDYEMLFKSGHDIDKSTGVLKQPKHKEPEKEPEKEKSQLEKLKEQTSPHKKFDKAHEKFEKIKQLLEKTTEPNEKHKYQIQLGQIIHSMNQETKDIEHKKIVKHSMDIFAKLLTDEMRNDIYDDEEKEELLKILTDMKHVEPDVGSKEESALDKQIKYLQGHIDLIKEQLEKDLELLREDKKHLEHLLGNEERKEELPAPVRPAPQPVAPEPPNPKSPPSQQEEEMQMVQFDQSTLTSKGDKNIGNVRSIGFLAPMEELAKEDDVLLDETERSKSLRRFTNFRWVQSRQNSSLGDASPFQNMEDMENKRRYGNCFIPVNKMPKPEPTEEELEKFKNFNKYNLVPSYGLDSISQPATEYSFKTSQSKFARKIGIDDEQFGNKKYYSFGEGRKPNKPNNPFNASHGMEPYNQAKKNADPKDNTLEYSSILYEDDPFKRKHKFIQRAKLFYA